MDIINLSKTFRKLTKYGATVLRWVSKTRRLLKDRSSKVGWNCPYFGKINRKLYFANDYNPKAAFLT